VAAITKQNPFETDSTEFTTSLLGLFTKDFISTESPFYVDPVNVTKREERCLIPLANRLRLAFRGENHISSILVGMKGVGKTTL
jgi:hypothetical protein